MFLTPHVLFLRWPCTTVHVTKGRLAGGQLPGRLSLVPRVVVGFDLDDDRFSGRDAGRGCVHPEVGALGLPDGMPPFDQGAFLFVTDGHDGLFRQDIVLDLELDDAARLAVVAFELQASHQGLGVPVFAAHHIHRLPSCLGGLLIHGIQLGHELHLAVEIPGIRELVLHFLLLVGEGGRPFPRLVGDDGLPVDFPEDGIAALAVGLTDPAYQFDLHVSYCSSYFPYRSLTLLVDAGTNGVNRPKAKPRTTQNAGVGLPAKSREKHKRADQQRLGGDDRVVELCDGDGVVHASQSFNVSPLRRSGQSIFPGKGWSA